MTGDLRFIKCIHCGYEFASTAEVTAVCRNEECRREFKVAKAKIVGDRPKYTQEDCEFVPAVNIRRKSNYNPGNKAPKGNPDIKICRECSRPLSLWQFDNDPAEPYGIAAVCKECKRGNKG